MKSLLLNETEASFKAFDTDWRADMAAVSARLAKDSATFLASYRRLVSLQAWRAFLETRISDGSLAFFLEAQNDALTSHVFANLGSWRSALKALRGCIDNILYCIFYKDHAIELRLWHEGKHKLTFAEHFTYLDNHPDRVQIPQIDAMPVLRAEYATLSKAVHASAKSFRMTHDIKETLLWSDAAEQRGKWQTREQEVLLQINLCLLAVFRHELGGAAAPGLRDAIGLAVPTSKFADIKTHMNVVIRKV
jgi:hypothetical protein